jgi:HD-GYP domain-containing protein (c-di-GMP phosphodiesterase class II)
MEPVDQRRDLSPDAPRGRSDEVDRTHVRLAELVAALSLGIDLGFGQPMEHVLRQCLIALRLGEAAGLDEAQRAAVYYTALLLTVGCHSDAHEQAKWFGDDIAMKATKYDYEPRSMRAVAGGLRLLGSGHPPMHRFRVGLEFAISGHRDVASMIAHHAELARSLAEHLELEPDVRDALAGAYERWDGKGWPGESGGEEVPMAARVASIAEYAEVANRLGGPPAVRELARTRRGQQFDPTLSDVLDADADIILSGLDEVGTWDAVVAAEPGLARVLSGDGLDRALVALADFVDLKSPYFLGHARAVAELAAEAGEGIGLDAADVRTLRRAGLVHGFGRLGVSNAIWDKRGPLGAGEWERVRLQPHLTERMLRQSADLVPIAAVAVQHRERLDGSGYPHGLEGGSISQLGRILAAVDAYQAMREPRPHRGPRSADQAAGELRADVRAGRLDAHAVDAVLAAAGHAPRRRPQRLAGLTAREAEVLVHLARGLSNKQIAELLVISPKTVSNHIEHIYSKIGVSNRAGASLFATRTGLLP